MRKSLLQLPSTTPPEALAPRGPMVHDTRPRGGAREYVTTTVRFKRATLARLKKAAIDRNQSLQEMIEQALDGLLRAETGKGVPGLRGGTE